MKQLALLFFLLLIVLSIGYSQQNDRPKIGLVLSGGGAKGMAHIGIIRELERIGIRPDYVTGTSMGSVIGGLYAAGYSADEIEEIALAMDWESILSNNTTLDQINYTEKKYYNRYIIELGVKKGKIELPRGLIEGQRLSEMLSKLTRHVHEVEDFNDLPIPFACVGTDIATGEAVVLNHGSLPLAIRASMAIPSIFTPVEIDGRLLVDGGLVRNFPVPECKAMGADIIIGVFVSGGLLKKDELKSAVDVLSQSAFVLSAFDSEEQMKKCDILISPDITNFSTMGFDQTPAIIVSGEEAAAKARPQLQALADSLGIKPEMYRHDRPDLMDSFLIDEIQVINNQHISDNFIRRRLRITPGQYYSIDWIEQRVDALFGSRYFDKVIFEIKENEGHSTLILTVQESMQAQLKLALHFDSENKAGLNLNFTKRNLIPDSRIVVEADIAENPRVDLNFLKYLGGVQKLAFQLGGNYRANDVLILEDDGTLSGVFRSEYFNPYLSIFNTSRRNYLTGIKAQFESTLLEPKVAGEELRTINKLDWKSWSTELFFGYNSLNRKFFPSSGAQYEASLKYSWPTRYDALLDFDSLGILEVDIAPNDFFGITVGHNNKWQLSRKLSIGLKDAIVMNLIDRDGPLISEIPVFNDQVLMGGFRPLPVNSLQFWGAEPVEFIADHLFYHELMLQYEPLSNIYIQIVSQYLNTLYPMKWLYEDVENSYYYLPNEKHSLWGYGAMLSYMSVIGPVSFGIASHQETSKWNGFFSIGFYF